MGFVKFLGTAGARFVMIRQLRSSAGIWINHKSTNILIDPGPGSLVRCNASRPKLDPTGLDGIILTHKHLDHSGDINVMIEAMTDGGLRRRGVLFVPEDALGEDGVIFSYLENHVARITHLKEGNFSVGDCSFEVPLRNVHSVETYGLKFSIGDEIVSIVSDTKYFDGLLKAYSDSTLLILNVVFYQRRDQYEHLCLEDALEIIKKVKPKKSIITHFGMTMLKAKPHLLEQKIRKELDMDIQFAYDGLTYNFS
ncbi:MAG: MBL fold metallo-hydrolase [Candidatus Omnitrophota bacterium]|nr:MAG: MBL fold metallo-hydrolase [Candidatus Omnitrophota bacterium]